MQPRGDYIQRWSALGLCENCRGNERRDGSSPDNSLASIAEDRSYAGFGDGLSGRPEATCLRDQLKEYSDVCFQAFQISGRELEAGCC